MLGFGQGNYRDELAQALAQNGNGVAAYIDTLSEAQKVLVQEAGASLFTIAKDVKLQVEFNPATVAEYRLVGYETRALKREDFNNDAVDAGDVGSGHTVTAIYEITPVGSATRMVDPSRYAEERAAAGSSAAAPTNTASSRSATNYPTASTSQLIEQPILIASRDVPQNAAARRAVLDRRGGLRPAAARRHLHGLAELRRRHPRRRRPRRVTIPSATGPSSCSWCARPRSRGRCRDVALG